MSQITIQTHEADVTGARCVRCDTSLPGCTLRSVWVPRTRVGLIVAKHGGTRSYPIGENDSNQECTR